MENEIDEDDEEVRTEEGHELLRLAIIAVLHGYIRPDRFVRNSKGEYFVVAKRKGKNVYYATYINCLKIN